MIYKLMASLALALTVGTASAESVAEPVQPPAIVETISEVASSTDTFAVCKGLDVATTMIALGTGVGVEANPAMAALLQHGYIPVIALGFAVWWLLDELNDPTTTTVANVITCGVVVNNLMVIL